jgi:hypothetical protein
MGAVIVNVARPDIRQDLAGGMSGLRDSLLSSQPQPSWAPPR